MKYLKLAKKAKKLRQKTFQSFIERGEAHLGGSFSMIEALIAIFEILKKKNDKFILSKSHASFPFCILLREKGFKPKISTHLEIDVKNGIHCTTGSLGHGLPIATGMALANKLKKNDNKIYVMMSDGECQEGTTWESLLIASKHRLNNLVIFVDYNKIQALSKIKDVLPLDSLIYKFKSFNLNTINVKNGHSFKQIESAFKKISLKKPNVIILNTIKGKGISKFENDPIWHARKLTQSDIAIGRKDLFS